MTKHLHSHTEACWIAHERHCPRFFTADHKGTGAISSLLWLIIRQNQLSIEGLVAPLPLPTTIILYKPLITAPYAFY